MKSPGNEVGFQGGACLVDLDLASSDNFPFFYSDKKKVQEREAFRKFKILKKKLKKKHGKKFSWLCIYIESVAKQFLG